MLQSQDLRVGQVKKPYIRVNIRELNEILATKLSTLYMLDYWSMLYYQLLWQPLDTQGPMILLTSKPQRRSIMWEFTRELDKESLLN